jgi:hypothetical protein
MRKKKLNLWLLSAVAAVCVAPMLAASADAQVQVPANNNQMNQPGHMTNNPANPNRMDAVGERHSCKSSEIVGLTVRTSGDEEKGKIKDLVIGQDGRVEYAAVSFGGF